MFKKGDKVKIKNSYNSAYGWGIIIFINKNEKEAVIRWNNTAEKRLNSFTENWTLRSLITTSEPSDLLKEIL